MSNSFLYENEAIVKKGMANLKKRFESVGGHLYLTDSGRLVHVPHAINIQNGIVDISVFDIAQVRTGWTTLLGIPVTPNALIVTVKDGVTYKYVVYGKQEWLKAIKSVMDSGSGNSGGSTQEPGESVVETAVTDV